MAFVKFEENRFRIDGEIAENHAILVNLTASIVTMLTINLLKKELTIIINTWQTIKMTIFIFLQIYSICK